MDASPTIIMPQRMASIKWGRLGAMASISAPAPKRSIDPLIERHTHIQEIRPIRVIRLMSAYPAM
jgi:hypothetical protein